MSYFSDVSAGDEWRPEPAPRYNAVNRLLGDLGYSGGGKSGSAGPAHNMVTVVNRHTDVIAAGAAVEAIAGAPEQDETLLPVRPSTGAAGILYGVLLGTLQKGDIGHMLMTGTTRVQLSAALTAGTRYVEPDPAKPGFFKMATGGRAQVIASTAAAATILLGGGGNAEYNGYFKIIDLSEKDSKSGAVTYQVAVVDGFKYVSGQYTEEHICGIVSTGGDSKQVKTRKTTVPESGTLYLYTIKTADGFAIVSLASPLGFSLHTPNLLLGTVERKGEALLISQNHTTGAIHLDTPYNGMFSVAVTAKEQNGTVSYRYSVKGGTAYVNATSFEVADLPEAELVAGTSYLQFSAEYDPTDKTFQNGRIITGASPQSSSGYRIFQLIATISVIGGMVSVSQNHFGEIQTFMWGECDHGEA